MVSVLVFSVTEPPGAAVTVVELSFFVSFAEGGLTTVVLFSTFLLSAGGLTMVVLPPGGGLHAVQNSRIERKLGINFIVLVGVNSGGGGGCADGRPH